MPKPTLVIFLTTLIAACSTTSGPSSPTPVSQPVAPVAVIMTVSEGTCCNRSPVLEAPWVSYGRCGSLRISGTASITYFETMSVYGPDGTFYFSGRQGPLTLNAGFTRGGCSGSFRDSDASRIGTTYTYRVDYTLDNGVSGAVDGSAAIRANEPLVTGIVIRQFRARGPRGAEDEFVELMNISDQPINIRGWSLSSADAGSSRISYLTSLDDSSEGILNPGCSYLAVGIGYSGSVPRDAFGVTGVFDNAGLALRTRGGQIVDQVSMSSPNLFLKGSSLESFGDADTDRAYVRVGNTGDDRNDYRMVTPSAPRNLAMCGR